MKLSALALTLLLLAAPSAFGMTADHPAMVDPQAQARLIDLPDPDCDRLRNDALACLACNIYHEARSEGADGMKLVGKITMNRVGSQDFPDDVCAVVWQRHGTGPAQFSWTHDGRSDRVGNPAAWRRAVRTAALMIQDHYDPRVTVLIAGQMHGPDDLWFHAGHVRPRWTANLELVARIGRHVVYRRPGR